MTEMYDQEKHRFYEIASRRFKAELKLYGATAAIHLENKNDEMFWGKVPVSYTHLTLPTILLV